ncbi:MAG: hypothetical protein PHI12_08830 [Dehalococcoidales bacterium]|nr:hypothetical protein [Dehalococcoidales bacterium]
MKLEIKGDTAIIDGEDNFLGKLIAGCEGKVLIKSPYIKGGQREIKSVKDKSGKELGLKLGTLKKDVEKKSK